MKQLPRPGAAFSRRKQQILAQLSAPEAEYADASPKGSVDAGIRQLIDAVNTRDGLVTTSSCAGRVSVYLEGRKKGVSPLSPRTPEGAADVDADGEGEGDEGRQGEERLASTAGGKGGGEWLFVSHDPVPVGGGEGYEAILGLDAPAQVEQGRLAVGGGDDAAPSRLIHFKFEPMILHVLTASLEHAQLVVQAGMEAGFRETGAVSLLRRLPDEEATPMVAVRSMGLSFESLIGTEIDGVRRSIVPSEYFGTLMQIANERFAENQRRIARFGAALEAAFASPKEKENWEDAQARRDRKRQEGLRRREEVKKEKGEFVDEPSLDLILQQPDVL